MKHSLNKGTAKESILANFSEQQNLEDTLNNKQDKLVSGTNIKTINGNSILGSGNITIEGGGGVSSVFEDIGSLPETPDDQKIYRKQQFIVYVYYFNSLINYNEIIEQGGASINFIQVKELPTNPLPSLENDVLTVYVLGNDIYTHDSDHGWFSNDAIVNGFLPNFTYGGRIDSLDTSNLVTGTAYLYFGDFEYVNVCDNKKFTFADKDKLSEEINTVKTDVTNIKTDVTTIKSNITNIESNKQNVLVSGETIKTLNGQSILGSGDIPSGVGSPGSGGFSEKFNDTSNNKATGIYSHAEGRGTEASGSSAHAEGQSTFAHGEGSHAEGGFYNANNIDYNTEYIFTTVDGGNGFSCDTLIPVGTVIYFKNSDDNFAGIDKIMSVTGTESPYIHYLSSASDSKEGNIYKGYVVNRGAIGPYSHVEGSRTLAFGMQSHAEGNSTKAIGSSSHAEGSNTISSGTFSHAEGSYTTASGDYSHAEGYNTNAKGAYSHAEGYNTNAKGYHSHAEGYATTSSGEYSHAEGHSTTAFGNYSHAEGRGAIYSAVHTFTRTSTQYQYTSTSTFKSGVVLTDQNGTYAKITAVSGTESPYTYIFGRDFTTTEGETVNLYQVFGVASGEHSHAEGYFTSASGEDSHAEGISTIASGKSSHAEGTETIAAGPNQHAQGKYNVEDSLGKYAHIVGNGSHSARSNAHTLDWNGNAWFKGNVRVGGTSWDDATELGSGGSGGSTKKTFELYTFPTAEPTLDDSGNTQIILNEEELATVGNFFNIYTNGGSLIDLYILAEGEIEGQQVSLKLGMPSVIRSAITLGGVGGFISGFWVGETTIDPGIIFFHSTASGYVDIFSNILSLIYGEVISIGLTAKLYIDYLE